MRRIIWLLYANSVFEEKWMIKVKRCPRCDSKNVKWVIPQMWSLWECYDCG